MLFSSKEAPYQYKKVGLIKNRVQGTHPKLVVETDDLALLNHRFDTINLTTPNLTRRRAAAAENPTRGGDVVWQHGSSGGGNRKRNSSAATLTRNDFFDGRTTKQFHLKIGVIGLIVQKSFKMLSIVSQPAKFGFSLHSCRRCLVITCRLVGVGR